MITSDYSGGNAYGTLDGVRWISGFNNAAENTFAEADKPFFSGVGTGRLRNVIPAAQTPTQVWTLTCSVVVPGGGIFTVTSTETEGISYADATTGIPYETNEFLQFELIAGLVDFQVGDQFIIQIAQYIVVQDMGRNGNGDYAAIRLE